MEVVEVAKLDPGDAAVADRDVERHPQAAERLLEVVAAAAPPKSPRTRRRKGASGSSGSEDPPVPSLTSTSPDGGRLDIAASSRLPPESSAARGRVVSVL